MFNRATLAVLISSLAAACANKSPERTIYAKHHYVAVGVVASSLDPRVISGEYSLSDSSDEGWQLALGRRLGQQWQLELSYTDAGSATLKSIPTQGQNPTADVAVSYTASALNLAWMWRPHSASLNAYARVGVAALDTSARSGTTKIPVDQLQDTQFVLGAGLEWRLNRNMRLRLAHDLYDRDASWSTLSLLTDFGPTIGAVPATAQPLARSELVTPIPTPHTEKAQIIAPLQCRTRDIELNFARNSHQLLADDMSKLQLLIGSLDKRAQWHVKVEGHADARGPSRSNISLSERRVSTVLTNLLVLSGGADNLRLSSRALGDKSPIASNRNPVGRARNRRVKVVFDCGE